LLDRKLRLDFKGNGLGRKTFSSHGELVVTGRQTPKRDVAKVIGFKCPIDSYSSTKDCSLRMNSRACDIGDLQPQFSADALTDGSRCNQQKNHEKNVPILHNCQGI